MHTLVCNTFNITYTKPLSKKVLQKQKTEYKRKKSATLHTALWIIIIYSSINNP